MLDPKCNFDIKMCFTIRKEKRNICSTRNKSVSLYI